MIGLLDEKAVDKRACFDIASAIGGIVYTKLVSTSLLHFSPLSINNVTGIERPFGKNRVLCHETVDLYGIASNLGNGHVLRRTASRPGATFVWSVVS